MSCEQKPMLYIYWTEHGMQLIHGMQVFNKLRATEREIHARHQCQHNKIVHGGVH